jgi:uncharacterized protein (DUF58 family)
VAGVAAVGCAYALGENDVLWAGVLLTVLPLMCALTLHRSRNQLSGGRRLTPSWVPATTEARVSLRVDNLSRVPTGLLRIQDHVPHVFGPRPRFVLDRMEPGGHREVTYKVRAEVRGRYALGPLHLRLTDPFGLCEVTHSLSGHDSLTVVPKVTALPPVRLSGGFSSYGDGHNRTPALTGDDDIIPRDYRHGDDLRRVHWRSTAKYGELMVRREEQSHRSHCTVLLDTRRLAYYGAGPDVAFEWAVSSAASIATHLLKYGYSMRLLTDTGSSVPGPTHSASVVGSDASSLARPVLEALAVIGHSGGAGLSRARDMLGSEEGALLVAFLGDLDEEQAALVARMGRRASAAVAFQLSSEDWAPQHRPPTAGPQALQQGLAAARRLQEAGWTVVRVPPGQDMAKAWQRIDRHRQDEDAGPVPEQAAVQTSEATPTHCAAGRA